MIKNKTTVKSFLFRFSCLLFCLPCFIFAGCNRFSQSKTEVSREKIMKTNTETDAPFACNPSALSKDEQVLYSALTKQLISEKQEVKELPDGSPCALRRIRKASKTRRNSLLTRDYAARFSIST